MMFLGATYQKILEWVTVIGGALGLYYYIRYDAYEEGQDDLNNQMLKDYYKQERQDAIVEKQVDVMHIDDISRMLRETGRYYQ